MAMRKNESMGFVDAAMAELGGPRSAALLERLDDLPEPDVLAAEIAEDLQTVLEQIAGIAGS